MERVIGQWASARPDLDTAPVAVIARLGRATAYLDGWINQGLAESGLSRPSWDVLASLRRVGPPHRLSPTELYRGLMRTSGAITHRLARLEAQGLIRRVGDPDDRRGLLVELTPEGVALVDRVAPAHLEPSAACSRRSPPRSSIVSPSCSARCCAPSSSSSRRRRGGGAGTAPALSGRARK